MIQELLNVSWLQMFVFALKFFSAFGLASLCFIIPAAIIAALLD